MGTTPTHLDAGIDWKHPKVQLLVRFQGPVFVGGPAVTTATGVPMTAGDSLSADLVSGAGLYAVAASGTQVCHVLQVRG